MLTRKNIFNLLVVLCVTQPAVAEEKSVTQDTPAPYNLTQCIHLADTSHPKIGLAKARLLEAEALISAAESGKYPTLRYQAGVEFYNDDLMLEDLVFAGMGEQDITFQGQNQLRAGVEFEWPVYTWDRVTKTVEAGQLELEARQLEMIRARHTAIHNAICAYWTMASAKEAQRYLDATINELRQFLETASADMKSGAKNAPEKDVIQIRIDIHSMEAWRTVLHRWAESARQALSISTGIPLEQVAIVDSEVKYEPIRVSYDQCLASAFRHRTDLQAFDRRIEELELLAEVQQKANYPDLALVSRGHFLEDDYGPSQNFRAMIGLEMHGVLYDGSRNDAKTDKIRAEIQILKQQQNELRSAIRQEVRDAYLTVKESYGAVIQFHFARQQTMAKLSVVRDGYPMLLSSVKDVQETQVERRFRDKDYIFAKLKLIKSLAKLNYVSGSTVYDFALLQRVEDGVQISVVE